MQLNYHIVIPMRLGSTRLPGKVLLPIAGKTLAERVYLQAVAASAASVTIATDDDRIRRVASDFGADVCMTSPAHPTGTERIAEVCKLKGWGESDIIVNVQGDEPFIPPAAIDQVALNLEQTAAASMASLYEPIRAHRDVFDPNIVKVVVDHNDFAIQFSRAPIPWVQPNFQTNRDDFPLFHHRHLGIYAYTVGFLQQYISWERTPLEQLERLEQLRVLYYGHKIHVAKSNSEFPPGIDCADDLVRAEEHFMEKAL